MSTARPSVHDRFHLEGLLGVGGFASVWTARDTVLDTAVAVKVLADNWTAVPEIRARFLDEVRMLRRVSSPHVVRVYDLAVSDAGRPYFAMELADRGTLEDRAAGTPMPLAEALDVLRQVTAGVAALHRTGVVHRDLKPSNVLLRWDTEARREVAVVADLGLGKSLADGSGFTVAAGSSGYAAPEQRRLGGGIGPRSDVYALGALAYRLLTGANPPEQPPGPRSLRSLPAGLGAVVGRAMAPLAADRWPSAEAFGAAVDRSAAGRGRSRRARAALVLPPVALVLALAAADGVPGAAEKTVTSADGALSVTVPASWSRQVRLGGWDPGGADREPAVEAAPDLGRFHDLAVAAPGVFVGRIGRDQAGQWRWQSPPTGCGSPEQTRFTSPDFSGELRYWQRCSGPGLGEAVLTGTGPDAPVLVVQVRGEHRDVQRLLTAMRAK
ncbi:serine/threonine-protein kinase [Lentzea sp. NPDC060358]|uniref:serine/threonine-protein kinase n=1 Tax=Lentzea sp. NPDC060358 TaxID=3347103 RepID=UPI00365D6315